MAARLERRRRGRMFTSASRVLRGLLVVGVIGCQVSGVGAPVTTPSGPPPPGRTFVADAPIGFDPHVLGAPVDGNFHAAPGVGAIFSSVSVTQVPANAFTVDQKLVTTAEELSANAQAWGVLDVSGATSQRERYAYFRAVQMTQAWELQAQGPMLQPPPWAVYYASKVYFGRSYVEVIKGDSNSFNARVAAHFLSVPVGGSVKSFVDSHHLTSHRAGTGLTPRNGQAVFARTQQDIEGAYVASGEVPIAVEYTQLPRTQANGVVIFPEPHPVMVRFVNLHVTSTGSMVKDYSNWAMSGQCVIDGPPDGDLDEPQGHSGPFLQQKVGLGTWPLDFSQTIYASDDETVTCTAGGTYTRGLLGTKSNLGPSSTGPILVRNISGPVQQTMPGRDAETAYDLTWTAIKQ
jgi:hypothetical protein